MRERGPELDRGTEDVGRGAWDGGPRGRGTADADGTRGTGDVGGRRTTEDTGYAGVRRTACGTADGGRMTGGRG